MYQHIGTKTLFIQFYFEGRKNMKFENAFRGVKKIFTAEILLIIAACCSIVAGSIFIISIAPAAAASQAGTALTDAEALFSGIGVLIALIVFLGYLVLTTIAFILHIVGVANASHDDSAFKTALYLSIAAIVLAIVSGIFNPYSGTTINTTNEIIYTIANSCKLICELAATLFIIQGIINLADKLNNNAMVDKGKNIYKVIICIYALILIASVLSTIFRASTFIAVLAMIMLIVAGVLQIAQYILYLVYLAKAKKMLA